MKASFLWSIADGRHAGAASPWILGLGAFLDVLSDVDADLIAEALAEGLR